MGFKIDDRVARPLFMDDGTWLQEGDACLARSPMRRGTVTGITSTGAQPTMYTVRWDDGTSAAYLLHGLQPAGALYPPAEQLWRLSTNVSDGRIGGLARIAMAMPPKLWRRWVEDHLSDLDRSIAVHELEWSIEMAARAMGYVKVRANGGGHASGVKASHVWGTRIRRMLGCTHPEQDMEF